MRIDAAWVDQKALKRTYMPSLWVVVEVRARRWAGCGEMAWIEERVDVCHWWVLGALAML